MVKRVKQFTRNRPTKKPRKIILIGSKGNNKTETLYFRNFNYVQDEYTLRFADGNGTDPVNIVYQTVADFRAKDLDIEFGDLAFSVFDLDINNKKIDQLEKAKKIANKNHVRVITSNPCFEVWYILHFTYTTKKFNSNNEVLKELSKYLKSYSKSECDFGVLYKLTISAIENAEKLRKHNVDFGNLQHRDFSNPSTSVDEIVGLLISKDMDKNQKY